MRRGETAQPEEAAGNRVGWLILVGALDEQIESIVRQLVTPTKFAHPKHEEVRGRVLPVVGDRDDVLLGRGGPDDAKIDQRIDEECAML